MNLSKLSGDLIIGSADVRALYPSLDIDFTAYRVCGMLTVSKVKFQGLWYKEIGMYLAVSMTHDELTSLNLKDVCPVRTAGTRDQKPTVKSMRKDKVVDRYQRLDEP